MEESNVLFGISREDIQRMLVCFHAPVRYFRREEAIGWIADEPRICILASGSARLIRFDVDGKKSILERFEPNDIFSGLFTYTSPEELLVECVEDCEVLYIDFDLLTSPCENACACHEKLIANVILLLARKSRLLSAKIDILSQRSIRGKLTAYFEYLARSLGKRQFLLPQSLSDLADYLCVDRSAMMRELKKMNKEALVLSRGRSITLLYGV